MGDPYYDPYQDMGEGDMMAMYAQMNPQLFGNDPAKRLNYYQDLMSTLGTDLVQTAGVTNPAAEQYAEPMNQTGSIYGSDPFYASIFQAIEEGKDPITAAKLARDQLGYKGTPEEFNQQVVSVATQYAGERVQNQQARSQWEAENGGGWSMPDGSKYKQTPLGGNDVRATASEYDLMGAPDPNELFDQYVKQMGTRPKLTPEALVGTMADVAKGAVKSVRPWQSRGEAVSSAEPPAAPGRNLPPGVVDYTPDPGVAPSSPSGSSPTPSPRNQTRLAAPRLAGGNFFLEKAAKDSINNRVEQSKNTQVRSDANRNLMRRITALAGLLQGGFPE